MTTQQGSEILTRVGFFLAAETRAWPEVYHQQLATVRAGDANIAAAE